MGPVTDPFETCDCGQPAAADEVFCAACFARLPVHLRRALRAAVRRRAQAAFRTAYAAARKALAT